MNCYNGRVIVKYWMQIYIDLNEKIEYTCYMPYDYIVEVGYEGFADVSRGYITVCVRYYIGQNFL